jgi:hypothetical protein
MVDMNDPLGNNELAKDFLKETAAKVCQRLSRLHVFQPMKLSVRPTDTGGYKALVMATPKADLAFWVDKYARFPNRHLWYGYYWQDENLFSEALGHWGDYVQKEFVKGDANCTLSDPYHLRIGLDASSFGRPFLEKYSSTGEYFFGCFDRRTELSSSLVDRITSFFRKTMTPDGTIGIENLLTRKRKDFEKKEEQRLVKALRYARAHSVAAEQKNRDGYLCRICGFNFATAYPKLGSRFAEAHHRVSLGSAKGARVIVRPESFVTLCANCHRMVHRAESLFEGNPLNRVLKAWKAGQKKKRR